MTPASENLDAIVERAAELFHNHRRGHYGFKPWAEADAAQKNHARALMLRTAKHVLQAAYALAAPVAAVHERDHKAPWPACVCGYVPTDKFGVSKFVYLDSHFKNGDEL